jgi:hypothetical protein
LPETEAVHRAGFEVRRRSAAFQRKIAAVRDDQLGPSQRGQSEAECTAFHAHHYDTLVFKLRSQGARFQFLKVDKFRRFDAGFLPDLHQTR